jgi:transcriptional regulator with XRE-family HTH domain
MSTRKTKKIPGDADALRMLETLTRNDATMQEMLAEERSNAAVARQIYELRTARGLTQKQLAERVGTQQPVIARLEDADYQGHSLAMLYRIGAALGCRVAVGFVPRPVTRGTKSRRAPARAVVQRTRAKARYPVRRPR